MKAMIGNICLVDGVETALDITHLMVLSGYSNAWCKIEPIPLTEEWLLRMGFEKTHENPFLDYEWQYGWFTMSDDLKPYLGRYTDETPFKYVHQLQNLYFALTGEELAIDV